jgi:hypothetical protein
MRRFAAQTSPPLLRGGWQKSLIFDWGSSFLLPPAAVAATKFIVIAIAIID